MGNSFVVNVKVGIPYAKITKLENTVDYEIVLKIIKKHFEIPTPLLEELVYNIEQEVLQEYPSMKYFFLSIQKVNPPLESSVYSSEVRVEKTYSSTQ